MKHLVRAYYKASVVQTWIVDDADGPDDAVQHHESGEPVAEEILTGGEFVEELSEADEITEERARKLLGKSAHYTVVGRSEEEPSGAVVTGKAATPKEAARKYREDRENPVVFAVLEGVQRNRLMESPAEAT